MSGGVIICTRVPVHAEAQLVRQSRHRFRAVNRMAKASAGIMLTHMGAHGLLLWQSP
jgi:hypothetical protein